MIHYPSKHPRGERPSGKGRILVMDKEAIGLLHAISTGGYYKGDVKNSHCMVFQDLLTEETFVFFDPYEARRNEREWLNEWEGEQDGYLMDGVKMLKESEAIISHNFSGYDALALEILFGKDWHYNYMERRGKNAIRSDLVPNKVMDTLVMSRLLNPDRSLPYQAYALGANCGPHTIEAHGIRIGRYKPENEDWSKLTDHMVHRCIEDVAIGRDYYLWLMTGEWAEHIKRGRNPRTKLAINSAYRMELQEAFNMARQAYRGWRLDMPKSIGRHEELNKLIAQTDANFRPHMTKRLVSVPFKQADLTKITAQIEAIGWEYDTDDEDKAWGLLLSTLQNFTTDLRRGSKATHWSLTKKNGEYTKPLQKIFPEMRGYEHDLPFNERLVAGPFSPVEYEDIPLGNRETVKELIYPYGWRGVDFNDTDSDYLDEFGELPKPWSGKINEKSMKAWEERAEEEGYSIPEWCKGIAEWYIYCSRNGQILNKGDVDKYLKRKKDQGDAAEFPRQSSGKNQIRGLVARAWNFELGMEAQDYFAKTGVWPTDGANDPVKHDNNWRVPAEAFSIGTNTFRMRHKNVVNIPSRGLYPLRDLFIASDMHMILGCDGAGLELRMLAHFLNDKLYTDVVLNGDIHTHNQELAGLPIRDMAKTFIYAFLYGSGIANLAAVCGMSDKQMRETVERFKAELPALTKLVEGIEKAGNEFGYMLAVDGRWGRIRKKNNSLLVHTILNVLLQMTGSLCMKYSQCYAENHMLQEQVGLDEAGFPAFLANVHDEVQMEVREDEVEEKIYTISEAAWKAEEKAQFLDDKGRMWSAPRIVSKSDDEFVLRRRYHRAGELLALGMVWAGEFLKIRCPLAGEYMIGTSWGDTH